MLIEVCIKNHITIECLPGPTAFVPALVMSGFDTQSFVFEGFLPKKKGRQTKLQRLKEEKRTMVIYESPYRLVRALEDFESLWRDERRICVCREISKKFAENQRGTPKELITYFSKKTVKGEIVIVIDAKRGR